MACQLVFVLAALALLQGAYALQCYSCLPQYALNCRYPEQMAAVQCNAYQDTCFKFAGNVTVGSTLFVGQITRMCGQTSEFRRYKPRVYADSCTTARNMISTDNQIYNGEMCLCDDYDLCNKSSHVNLSFGVICSAAMFAVLTKLFS